MAGYGYGGHPYSGYPQGYNLNPNAQPFIPQDIYFQQNHHLLGVSSSDSLHTAFIGYDENGQPILPPQAGGRLGIRRRPVHSPEHVKHRRTRSGCYTCRSRRVKCDEGHPICERCRKGNRECTYPETQSSKSGRSSKTKSGSDETLASDDDEHDGKERLDSIPDEDEDDDLESEEPQSAITNDHDPSDQLLREASSPPSLMPDKSPTPSTEGSLPQPVKRPKPLKRSSRPKIKVPPKGPIEITPEIEFFLNYFRENITVHHYQMKMDEEKWFQTTFLDIAQRHAPLLYAVVGFAAYHHTLAKPDGQVSDFLKYYNTSVKLLRHSIIRKDTHDISTLLTILQLASIEEVLGDWINLAGHQKAAFELLTNLYSPETMTTSETLRKTFQWYIRFELFMALQAGSETILGHEWLDTMHAHFADEATKHPDNILKLYEERASYSRHLANNTAIMFARKGKGQISDEDFGAQLGEHMQKLAQWSLDLDPRLTDATYLVRDFSHWPERDPDDIVEPQDPTRFYGGERWHTNMLLLDYWAIEIMFKSLLAMIQQQPPGEEALAVAYKAAQTFEAIELCPESPRGAMIDAQASFGFCALFLPKDEKHTTWLCRKFAKIEELGYIYSSEFRTRISSTYTIDVSTWWLPTPAPPIIRSIRSFASERNSVPKDQVSEDLRVMKGIFDRMDLRDEGAEARRKEKDLRHREERGERGETSTSGSSPSYSLVGSEHSDQTAVWNDSPDFKWDYGQDGYSAVEGQEGYGVQQDAYTGAQ